MSKRSLTGLVAGLLLLLPVAAMATDEPVAESYSRWFVELSSAPTSEGTALSTINQEHNAFKSGARKAKLQYTEHYAFKSLFNGLSIEISPKDLGKLSRIPGVKALYPVVDMPLDLASATQMTGAAIAQSSLGYTGDGVKIGIIDTGVDWQHADLGGCFGPGCKVAYGYDFVGDAWQAGLTPAPDTNPDDCNGHGTHVAGIAAAKAAGAGGVTGVAPDATLGAYRVFGCTGSTTADVMIAAMEMALADGMDVINMSIGASYQWHEYPTADAATRMVNAGMVVVVSQGNSGANGLYATGAPAVGRKVISTGSVENNSITSFAFDVNGELISYNPATGAPFPPTSGTFDYFPTGTTTTANDACNATLPLPGGVSGKIALIRRGTCAFSEKSLNAQNAGAIGVVIFNNTSGVVNATVAGSGVTIPVVTITQVDGATMHAAATKQLTWGFFETSANAAGGRMASSSSWGVSPELLLKPNVSAPGASIWSTFPLELGGYASLSGTSMAAPHAAGAAALFLQAFPNTPSQAMQGHLQNSADPVVPVPLTGGLAFLNGLEWPLSQQGAGLIDIDDAILASVKVTPSELNLGEGEAGPQTRTIYVENRSGAPVDFDISYESAIAAYGDIPVGLWFSDEVVSFSAPTVSVAGGGTSSFDVTITPDVENDGFHGLYNGWIILTEQVTGETFRVPYVGFSGDYQAMTVWPAGREPFISEATGTFLDSHFTFVGTDSPLFWVHLRHQVRRLRFEVKATSGKSWHRAFPDFEYVGRSSATNTYFILNWDGITYGGKKAYLLPNGDYTVRVSVLKALGDDSNPAHWETVVLGPITIARP